MPEAARGALFPVPRTRDEGKEIGECRRPLRVAPGACEHAFPRARRGGCLRRGGLEGLRVAVMAGARLSRVNGILGHGAAFARLSCETCWFGHVAATLSIAQGVSVRRAGFPVRCAAVLHLGV